MEIGLPHRKNGNFCQPRPGENSKSMADGWNRQETAKSSS